NMFYLLRVQEIVRIPYRLISLALTGEGYDMVLRIGNLMNSTLIARCLGKLTMVICASPAYLRLRGTPQTGSELTQHNCLLYGRKRQYGWRLNAGNSLNTHAA
ncbi:LysR substrate-binding domain-containing protein, partial [Escherichia coli]